MITNKQKMKIKKLVRKLMPKVVINGILDLQDFNLYSFYYFLKRKFCFDTLVLSLLMDGRVYPEIPFLTIIICIVSMPLLRIDLKSRDDFFKSFAKHFTVVALFLGIKEETPSVEHALPSIKYYIQ